MNIFTKLRKKHFVLTFFVIVFVLFIIRLLFPSVRDKVVSALPIPITATTPATNSVQQHDLLVDSLLRAPHRIHPLKGPTRSTRYIAYQVIPVVFLTSTMFRLLQHNDTECLLLQTVMPLSIVKTAWFTLATIPFIM